MTFSAESITAAAIASFAQCNDPRTKTILQSLVKYLHAFAQETQLTQDEWMAGIQFLTATCQKCDDVRQEFILLSDTLGLSMLLVALHDGAAQGATEFTVLGPFHTPDAPAMATGSDLANGAPGEPLYVRGQVMSAKGQPVPHARVDVWQADAEDLYDVQRGELDHQRRARGLIQADADGHYPLVIHIFREGDRYLDSDVVFGVRPSLVSPFASHPAGTAPEGRQMTLPYWTMDYRFVMQAHDA